MGQFKKAQVIMLPTGSPSRLLKFANQLFFDKETEVKDKRNQHLYIISDDEIKEGDWLECERLILKLKQF